MRCMSASVASARRVWPTGRAARLAAAAAGALTLCGAGGRRRRIGSVQYQRDRLTPEERESLDRDGYLVIPALLEEPVIAPMRARLDELIHDTIVAWDADPDTGNAHSWVVEADLGLTDP